MHAWLSLLRLTVLGALLGAACNARPMPEVPADESRTTHELRRPEGVRSYALVAPPAPAEAGAKEAAAPRPLVLVLHGGLGNAASVERSTGMSELARREGFLVAYPDGTGGRLPGMRDRRTWNAGRCCGRAVREGVDDVGFLAALIDDVAARHPVDRRRVYATGMSNGAMMAYRLACEAPERVAAIVPVAGTLAVDGCAGANDVAVLHVHGELDDNVPLAGGAGEDSVARVEHRSVPETMRLLTEARGCGAGEEAREGGAVRTRWTCGAAAPVELLVVKGAGHVWPGGLDRHGERDPSPVDASEEAWRFLSRFAKEGER